MNVSTTWAIVVTFVIFLSVSQARWPADYIIVGAGTAGCTLAARLCALQPNSTIVLFERSTPRNASQEFLVQSPRLMLLSWYTEDLVERFTSLPTSALNNRSFTLFSGKTLGGTSSINNMQISLPVPGTIEGWGIRGLTRENSKKYYRRALNQLEVSVPVGKLRHRYTDVSIEAAKKSWL